MHTYRQAYIYIYKNIHTYIHTSLAMLCYAMLVRRLQSRQPYMHENHSNNNVFFISVKQIKEICLDFNHFSSILDSKRTPKGPPWGPQKTKDLQDPPFAPKGPPWGPPKHHF